MTLQRKLAMERAEGYAEGYAEGLELGKIEVLLECVRNGYMTIDRAADELGKTVEEVQAMLAEVKTNEQNCALAERSFGKITG